MARKRALALAAVLVTAGLFFYASRQARVHDCYAAGGVLERCETAAVCPTPASGNDSRSVPEKLVGAPLWNFYHLEKCGGTTMEHVMWRSCPGYVDTRDGELGFWEAINFAHVENLTLAKAAKLRDLLRPAACVSGHYYYDFEADLFQGYKWDRPVRSFTQFREPVARLVSLYNYHRAIYPGDVQMAPPTFKDFATNSTIAARKDNAYVRVFCRTASHKPWLAVSDEDYECALANIRKLDVVLILEEWDASLQMFSAVTGYELPEVIERKNQNKRHNVTDLAQYLSENQDALPYVDDLTKYDKLIYQEAVRLFEGQRARLLEPKNP